MRIHDGLASLLREHGLDGVPEVALEHTGFSGAVITRLVRSDGASFVLKRLSIERDWIMRWTDDTACREAAFAAAEPHLGARVWHPGIGVVRDAGEHAILMRDISEHLLPQARVAHEQLTAILDGMVALHAVVPPVAVPWCDISRRMTLLTPRGAATAASYGAFVAPDLLAGWAAFRRLASPSALAIIEGLIADPAPLVRALASMPQRFLHGDLKLDNVGIDASGRLVLIDWAMTLVAPPAGELGWFLAINSRRLPVSLDAVMEGYAARAGIDGEIRERHDAMTVLCGLLLRGWRKALDADAGEPEELRWWCERVEAAARFLP